MTTLTQYEQRNAIDAIDGYWQPLPHFTQDNARKAFEAAKEQNRVHRLRAIECIDAITFEQFLDARPCIKQHLEEYAKK